MRPRFTVLISAVGLAALVIPGCGGGSSSSPASGGQAEASPTKGTSEAEPGAGEGRSRGGEQSIEGFGSEADSSKRSALLAAFRGYLGAIAARHYPIACSYLSPTVQRSLSQLLAKGGKHPRCSAVLAKLLSPSAAATARQQVLGRVRNVRVRGGRAFVVFHAPGASLYQLNMVREGGRWKASTVTSSVLVPSAAALGR